MQSYQQLICCSRPGDALQAYRMDAVLLSAAPGCHFIRDMLYWEDKQYSMLARVTDPGLTRHAEPS